jgi:hypothetical protein
MLCVLGNTLFTDIESFNSSTFIIEYDKSEIIDHNPNLKLNKELQNELAKFPFDECPKIDPFK